jgi:hypothetical protein
MKTIVKQEIILKNCFKGVEQNVHFCKEFDLPCVPQIGMELEINQTKYPHICKIKNIILKTENNQIIVVASPIIFGEKLKKKAKEEEIQNALISFQNCIESWRLNGWKQQFNYNEKIIEIK